MLLASFGGMAGRALALPVALAFGASTCSFLTATWLVPPLPFAGKLLAAPMAGDDSLPCSGKALLPSSEGFGAGRARGACWEVSLPSPGKPFAAFNFFPSALAGLFMASNSPGLP